MSHRSSIKEAMEMVVKVQVAHSAQKRINFGTPSKIEERDFRPKMSKMKWLKKRI